MSNDRPLTGAFWAQVVPTYSAYWPDKPRGVKVAKISQRKPRNPEPGCLLVKVTITVPAGAFVPRQHEFTLGITDTNGELVPALAIEPPRASAGEQEQNERLLREIDNASQ